MHSACASCCIVCSLCGVFESHLPAQTKATRGNAAVSPSPQILWYQLVLSWQIFCLFYIKLQDSGLLLVFLLIIYTEKIEWVEFEEAVRIFHYCVNIFLQLLTADTSALRASISPSLPLTHGSAHMAQTLGCSRSLDEWDVQVMHLLAHGVVWDACLSRVSKHNMRYRMCCSHNFFTLKHMLNHRHASHHAFSVSRVQPLSPRVRPLQLWLLGWHSQAPDVSCLHLPSQ